MLKVNDPTSCNNDEDDLNLNLDLEEEAADAVRLADEIFQECKAACNIADLNTAIFLFCQALSMKHPTDLDLPVYLHHLAAAMLTRFNYTYDMADVSHAYHLLEPASRNDYDMANLFAFCNVVLSETEEHIEEILDQASQILLSFQQMFDLANLDTAVFMYRQVLHSALRSQHWKPVYNLAEALLLRFRHCGEAQDLEESISLFRCLATTRPTEMVSLVAAIFTKGNVGLSDVVLINRLRQVDQDAAASAELGTQLLQVYCMSNNISDLDAALVHLGIMESSLSRGHPSRPLHIYNLTLCLHQHFLQVKDPGDLDAEISLHREILPLLCQGHPIRWKFLDKLGDALHRQFEQQNDLGDLDAAVEALHAALREDLCEQAYVTKHLFKTLQVRSEKTSGAAEFENFVEMSQLILSLQPVPHPDRADTLRVLATIFLEKFKRFNAFRDLESAIECCNESLQILSESDHSVNMSELGHVSLEREQVMETLIKILELRFIKLHSRADLDSLIKFLGDLLLLRPVPHSERASTLAELGGNLMERYKDFNEYGDLDSALECYDEALHLPSMSQSKRSSTMVLIGDIHCERFKRDDNISDIEKALELLHQALSTLESGALIERSVCLASLGRTLFLRFKKIGTLEDIDEAIALHREALSLNSNIGISGLAIGLSARAEYTGKLSDLDSCIDLCRQIVNKEPQQGVGTEDLAYVYSNLCTGALKRYALTNSRDDLDTAISAAQEALTLHSSTSICRANILKNLGQALLLQYNVTHIREDLENSVKLQREALQLRSTSELLIVDSSSLAQLAATLQELLVLDSFSSDADEVLNLYHAALALCPSPNPARGVCLHNLGLFLMKEAEDVLGGQHRDKGARVFREACSYEYSSVSRRFTSAKLWFRFAHTLQHPSVLEACQTAIDLLLQNVSLGKDLNSRHEILASLALTDTAGIACEAAACAITCNELAKAVEFLEAGRSVFWSQASQLRVPLNELRVISPELGGRATDLLQKLEESSYQELSSCQVLGPLAQEHTSEDLAAHHYRNLNADWKHTLEEIRLLPGFEDFLCPKTIHKLQSASKNGPIVVLNASIFGCAALILQQSTEIKCVPLPLNLKMVKFLVEALRQICGSGFNLLTLPRDVADDNNLQNLLTTIERLCGKQEGSMHSIPIQASELTNYVFELILAELWQTIVEPVFSALELKPSANPPRLWWCPTGPLTFLPIHAAGIYNGGLVGTETWFAANGGIMDTVSVSDFVVPSYTPTLAALLNAPTPTVEPFKMTVLIQPVTHGFSPLPGTRTELAKIQSQVPTEWLTSLGNTSPATKGTALTHLQDSSIVHLACHGIQDKFHPLDSGLVLNDGALKVSQIMKPQSQQKHMSLAFLSACETAKGDDQLPDEAMHLAATLQFAGFRGVVGTMWTIRDDDGPRVADAFYGHLFANCDPHVVPPVTPDLTEAARALHIAVKQLRDHGNVDFIRWVPFVHYGL
ncbi:CHAT domain-containing protein [Favolaschia claudopus]|uniref:CHAT domain-containing protein n=1 Tax=Favolaschia claudopus TaxID=2862362 RepID=A0AAW0DJ78_9AGAR